MNFLFSIRFASMLLAGVFGVISLFAEDQRERAAGRAPSAASAETRIDLNTADVKTLESVAVIGPEVARKIVAARPFETINDLDRIKGLTAEQLEQIRAKVTVSTIHVPAKLGMPTAGAGQRRSSSDARTKIDLNTADLETLASAPSIGLEAARAIVAARPFTTVNELNRVKGLSAEQLELIRLDVTVAPPPRAKKQPASSR